MLYIQYLQCLYVDIKCNQWKMDWNKMDSIVIMDKKCILLVKILSKLEGHIW
jgi:hypothetical protein